MLHTDKNFSQGANSADYSNPRQYIRHNNPPSIDGKPLVLEINLDDPKLKNAPIVQTGSDMIEVWLRFSDEYNRDDLYGYGAVSYGDELNRKLYVWNFEKWLLTQWKFDMTSATLEWNFVEWNILQGYGKRTMRRSVDSKDHMEWKAVQIDEWFFKHGILVYGTRTNLETGEVQFLNESKIEESNKREWLIDTYTRIERRIAELSWVFKGRLATLVTEHWMDHARKTRIKLDYGDIESIEQLSNSLLDTQKFLLTIQHSPEWKQLINESFGRSETAKIHTKEILWYISEILMQLDNVAVINTQVL
jgi:hypothetical protein